MKIKFNLRGMCFDLTIFNKRYHIHFSSKIHVVKHLATIFDSDYNKC